MENKDLITEGNVYELVDEQPIVEIGVETDSKQINKDEKDDFTKFKELYKGVIDMKCTQDYGTCDDKALWDDIAKELFLKSKNYVPAQDEKAEHTIEEAKLEESKELSRQ